MMNHACYNSIYGEYREIPGIHMRMSPIVLILMVICVILPSFAHATRGPEDYGIIMAFVFMVYTMPVGILLLSLIIFMFSRLKSKTRPRKGLGRAQFIISIVTLLLSIVLPLAIIHLSGWKYIMLELMMAVFVPIIALSVFLAYLSLRVRKRSFENDGPSSPGNPSVLH